MKTGIDKFTADSRNRILKELALVVLIVIGAPVACYYGATVLRQWKRGEPINPFVEFRSVTPGRVEIPEVQP